MSENLRTITPEIFDIRTLNPLDRPLAEPAVGLINQAFYRDLRRARGAWSLASNFDYFDFIGREPHDALLYSTSTTAESVIELPRIELYGDLETRIHTISLGSNGRGETPFSKSIIGDVERIWIREGGPIEAELASSGARRSLSPNERYNLKLLTEDLYYKTMAEILKEAGNRIPLDPKTGKPSYKHVKELENGPQGFLASLRARFPGFLRRD